MMRAQCRKRHRPAILGLALLVPILFSGCATSVGYLWKQGGYLLRYSFGAKPVSSLLKEPGTPPDLRGFFATVASIKTFASKQIGLKGKRDFTTYKRIDRDYLVNVVQAADPLSFARYQWSYPLLGKLPYKGYYDPADAEAEAKRLEAKGYDVIVRRADAFSTLGFLRDPLYSYMRQYSTYELASLIIHEETHATLFLKGQDQFNEGLATFVGDEGALQFLRSNYGEQSHAYEQAVAERADNRLFLQFIAKLKGALSQVYKSSLPRDEKLAKKAATIAEYRKIYEKEYLPRFHSEQYREMAKLPINNAYLMLFGLYTDDVSLLKHYAAARCGGDLKLFMKDMERLAKERGPMIPKIEQQLSAGGTFRLEQPSNHTNF